MYKPRRKFNPSTASSLRSGVLLSTFALALTISGCDPNDGPSSDSTEESEGSGKKEDPSQEESDSGEEEQDSGKKKDEKPKNKSKDDTEDGEDGGEQDSPDKEASSDGDSGDEPSPEKSKEEDSDTGDDNGEKDSGDDDTDDDEPGENGTDGDEPGDDDSDSGDSEEPGEDDSEDAEPKQIDCTKLVASGVNKGQVLPELAGTDENGESFSLHALCNKGVLLEVSTGWCGPCNQVAPHLEKLYKKYKDQGFEVVTVLAEGFRNGSPATAADLKRWRSKHGLTHKVVAPKGVSARAILQKYWSDSRGFPSSKLMAPGMVIHGAEAHSEKDAQIESALPKP